MQAYYIVPHFGISDEVDVTNILTLPINNNAIIFNEGKAQSMIPISKTSWVTPSKTFGRIVVIEYHLIFLL